jgi:hypothetical protein
MMVIPESHHGTKFDIYIFIPPASIVWVYFWSGLRDSHRNMARLNQLNGIPTRYPAH